MKPTPRQTSASALIAVGLPLIAAPAWATAGNADNVTFCHATASHTNPYVTITTDPQTFFQQGHDGHDGPVWTANDPRQAKWGDVVAPFHYSYQRGQETTSGEYPGKNWSVEGQAVLAAGCQAPPPVDPSPSVTATPSHSPSPTPTESLTPDPSVSASPDPHEPSPAPSATPSTTSPAATPTAPGRPDSEPPDGSPVVVSPTPTVSASVPAPVGSPSPQTSVLGTKVTRPPSNPPNAPSASQLPHTGLGAWPLTILGVGLVGVGAVLLRRPRRA